MSNEYYEFFENCGNILSKIEKYIHVNVLLKNTSIIQILKNLQTIYTLLKHYLEKYKFISFRVHEFDFDVKTKANGYRSQMKIGEKIFGRISQCIDKLKGKTLILNLKMAIGSKIKRWKYFLIAYYPFVCATLKMINLNYSGLLLPKENTINAIFQKKSYLLIKCALFSSLLGFQYDKELRRDLNLLTSVLASYGHKYDNKKSSFDKLQILRRNGIYLTKPNKRVKSLKKFILSPSIEIYQRFFSLLAVANIPYIITSKTKKLPSYKRVPIFNSNFMIKNNQSKDVNISDLEYTNELTNLSDLKFYLMKPIKCMNKVNKYEIFDDLILYFHGGGFVTLSTKDFLPFHQDLCTNTGAAIFSINYSLSPKVKFPIAAYECFYTYCWILSNKEKIGWSGKRIILSGDSAGGNLVLSVTQMAILKNIKTPNGCVCLYPLCTAAYIQSPSRLLIYIDPLVSSGFLNASRNAYFGLNASTLSDNTKAEYKNSSSHQIKVEASEFFLKNKRDILKYLGVESLLIELFDIKEKDDSNSEDENLEYLEFIEDSLSDNPFASPLYMDNSVIKKFPSVRMIISEFDPFLDENIEMSKRFQENKVDIKLDIVSDMPHGFINFITKSNKIKKHSKRISQIFKQLFII